MIAEQYIKQSFIQKVLSDEVRFITNLQAQAFRELGLHKQSGELLSMLKSIPSVQSTNKSVSISQKYVKYMRFLDMRKGFPLYNKIVYGRIYGHAIAVLQYGFSNEIKEALMQELQESMKIDATINI